MANRNDIFETLDTMRNCGMSDKQILEELLGNTLSTAEAIDNLEQHGICMRSTVPGRYRHWIWNQKEKEKNVRSAILGNIFVKMNILGGKGY